MRDILTTDGKPMSDLSKRMGDNVVEALIAYMQAPGTATGEAVHAYSIALNSLALLAIAEQLQQLNEMLTPEKAAEGIINPEDSPDPNECRECAGTGLCEIGGDGDVTDCPFCHGVGRVWA